MLEVIITFVDFYLEPELLHKVSLFDLIDQTGHFSF